MTAAHLAAPEPAPPSAGPIVRQLFHHAWPILIAQLLSMGMMIADTVIAGRYGTNDLAGVAIGSSFYISVIMLLAGTLQAIAPTVAHHVGAGRHGEIGPAMQQGFWLAAMLAVPGVGAMLAPGALLQLAEVPPGVAAIDAEFRNPARPQSLHWLIRSTSKDAANGVFLDINGQRVFSLEGTPLAPGSSIRYAGGEDAAICDPSWKEIARVRVRKDVSTVPNGGSRLKFGTGTPLNGDLKLEVRTYGDAIAVEASR